jgi:DNA-binding NarL/FixJ family response regulator
MSPVMAVPPARRIVERARPLPACDCRSCERSREQRLIVDGKTNCEIASELVPQPKTVETHIRNMFRKLDADSRVEIARAVERADKELADLRDHR